MSFDSLGLAEPVLRGIAEAGYDSPTEIQLRTIPLALEGHDIVALAETGSGKTAAYGLPILHRLLGGTPGLRALILVPTRELCVQVAENLRAYACHTDLEVRTAFGGIPITIQEAAFKRGLDVLVACPGRLIDHFTCGNLSLDRVETLVLDEADRMLDMGFIPQIRRILVKLPQKRQNCMLSATMLPEVERLVQDFFGETKNVQVGRRSQAAATITHRFENVRAPDKLTQLDRLLRSRDGTVLIFVKTKIRAEELGRKLARAGLPADSIHGDKSAESRHVVLRAFARSKARFLVATDVAARGIDVSDIGLVVNYDMPHAVEDYIHRVGRTGRVGNEGEALTYVTRPDKGMLRGILAHLERTSGGTARVLIDEEEVGEPPARVRGDRAERTPARAQRRTGRSSHGERSGRRGRDESRDRTSSHDRPTPRERDERRDDRRDERRDGRRDERRDDRRDERRDERRDRTKRAEPRRRSGGAPGGDLAARGRVRLRSQDPDRGDDAADVVFSDNGDAAADRAPAGAGADRGVGADRDPAGREGPQRRRRSKRRSS